MANKKLTDEQLKEIKILQANAEMLQKTKKEAIEHGRDAKTLELIEIARQDVVSQMELIDKDAAKQVNETVKQNADTIEDFKVNLNKGKSVYDAISELKNNTSASDEATKNIFAANTNSNAQYDVVSLPSKGEGYKNKIAKVPVAFLTAYDENLITSPSLYRDGLVIDCLLKSKIMNNAIDPDELLSGDADAIILFLRATSYGVEYPIVVNDPQTGQKIESVVDLSTLKPKEFNLKGDEDGYFDFVLPLSKDVVKFRYLTRKDEKNLELVSNMETKTSNASIISRGIFEIRQIMNRYEAEMTTKEKKDVEDILAKLEGFRKKLSDSSDLGYNKIVTNRMEMNIVAVNGNYDRNYIHEYVNSMRAKDSLELRKYINENEPGIDFNIKVERPESLGGGSFETFLEWNDSVFLNIA